MFVPSTVIPRGDRIGGFPFAILVNEVSNETSKIEFTILAKVYSIFSLFTVIDPLLIPND